MLFYNLMRCYVCGGARTNGGTNYTTNASYQISRMKPVVADPFNRGQCSRYYISILRFGSKSNHSPRFFFFDSNL